MFHLLNALHTHVYCIVQINCNVNIVHSANIYFTLTAQ